MQKLKCALIVPVIVLLSACNDKEKKEEDNCIEGRTGGLTIVTRMVHHTRPIKGCRVFVKYNATEFPGDDTTKYDYAFGSASDSPYATVDSLNCGSYYIYAIGIDSLLDPSNWIVKGGIPYSTGSISGIDSINVYITEGD